MLYTYFFIFFIKKNVNFYKGYKREQFTAITYIFIFSMTFIGFSIIYLTVTSLCPCGSVGIEFNQMGDYYSVQCYKNEKESEGMRERQRAERQKG